MRYSVSIYLFLALIISTVPVLAQQADFEASGERQEETSAIASTATRIEIEGNSYLKITMSPEELRAKYGEAVDLSRYRGYILQPEPKDLEAAAERMRARPGVRDVQKLPGGVLRVHVDRKDLASVIGEKAVRTDDGDYPGYLDFMFPSAAPLLPLKTPYPDNLEEVMAKRSPFSRTFVRANGTLTAIVTIRPTSFLDGPEWKVILPEDPVPERAKILLSRFASFHAYCVEIDNDTAAPANYVFNYNESYYSVVGAGEDTDFILPNHIYQRNALQFDISSIPNSANIDQATLNVYRTGIAAADADVSDEGNYYNNAIWPKLFHMTEKPEDYYTSLGGQFDGRGRELFDDAKDGLEIYGGNPGAWDSDGGNGLVSVGLGTSGASDLQSRLASGWYSIGVVDHLENEGSTTAWEGVTLSHISTSITIDYVVPTCILSIDESNYNYPSTVVGDCSAYYTFDLENTGTTTALGDISISGNSDFKIYPGDGGLFSLAPGSTRPIRVNFCPSTTGAKSATLEVVGNEICENVSVPLSGVGLSPASCVLTFNPQSHVFDNEDVGNCSNYATLTLSNTGNTTATGSINLADGDHFQIDPSDFGSFSLGAGSTKQVGVRFCPTSAGSHTDLLQVLGDGICNNTEVELSGEAVIPPVCDLALDSSAIPSPVPPDGGTYAVTLHNASGSCSWQTSTCNWVDLSPNAGVFTGAGSKQIMVTFEPNPTTDPRYCEVTVDCTGCQDIVVGVTQSGIDNVVVVGSLMLKGDSISGTADNRILTGNIEIGYVNEGFALRWPTGTASVTANTTTGAIQFSSGYSSFAPIQNCGLTFEAIDLAFNSAQGTALFAGDILMNGTPLVNDAFDVPIDFDNKVVDASGVLLEFAGGLTLPAFTCDIGLVNSSFTVGLEANSCSTMGPLAIDAGVGATATVDVCNNAVQFDVDLNVLTIGRSAPLGCIDPDSWIFSPVGGAEVHIRYDIDDYRIEFPERSNIAIPIPIAKSYLDSDTIEAFRADGKIVEDHNGKAFLVLGIAVEAGSYINFGAWDFNFVMDLSVSVAEQPITIDDITASYDPDTCEFTGGLGVSVDLFQDFVSVGQAGTFTFGGCADSGYYRYGITTEIELELLWTVSLMLDSELSFYNTGTSTSDWIDGRTRAAVNILGWEFGTGVDFALYPDRLLINGHEFSQWLAKDGKAGVSTVWEIEPSRVGGYLVGASTFAGIVEIPDGNSFNVNHSTFVTDPVLLEIPVNHHGIGLSLVADINSEVSLAHHDGISVSCGNSGTIRVMDPNGWSAALGPEGFVTSGNAEILATGRVTNEGQAILNIKSTPAKALPATLYLELEGTSGGELLDLVYVIGGGASKSTQAKLVNFNKTTLADNQTYASELDVAGLNVFPLVSSGQSIGYDFAITGESGSVFSINDIQSGWASDFSVFRVAVQTGENAKCVVMYGPGAPSNTSAESTAGTEHIIDIPAGAIEDGHVYQVVATSTASNSQVQSAVFVVGSGVCPLGGQGDLNCDCMVNIFDVVTVTSHFGEECGDPDLCAGSCADADVIQDCDVNIFDVVAVTGHFGESCDGGKTLVPDLAASGRVGDGYATCSLRGPSSKVSVGDTVAVEVLIESTVPVAGWQTALKYDKGVLGFVGFEESPELAGRSELESAFLVGRTAPEVAGWTGPVGTAYWGRLPEFIFPEITCIARFVAKRTGRTEVFVDQNSSAAMDGVVEWIEVSTERPTVVEIGQSEHFPVQISLAVRLVPGVGADMAIENPASCHARLRIYDVRGLLVSTVYEGMLAAGSHRFTWSGETDRGSRASSGVYFARLETEKESITKKTMLVK